MTSAAAKPDAFNFETVEKLSVQGQAIEEALRAEVRPSGLTHLLTAGSRRMDDIARRKGLDAKNYEVRLGADQRKGAVSVSPVATGSDHASAFRRIKKNEQVTIYLHDLFYKKPAMRPLTRRQCNVTEGLDNEGQPCLVIIIKSSLDKKKGPNVAKTTSSPKTSTSASTETSK